MKTVSLAVAPTYDVRFLDRGGHNLGVRSIAALTSEGRYTYVSREIPPAEIPAAAALASIELRLTGVAVGTAYFDDLTVVPLG